MGEKHRILSRHDLTTHAILDALPQLPATAKVADVVRVVNALLVALNPKHGYTTELLIPDEAKAAVAGKLAKAEAIAQKAQAKKEKP